MDPKNFRLRRAFPQINTWTFPLNSNSKWNPQMFHMRRDFSSEMFVHRKNMFLLISCQRNCGISMMITTQIPIKTLQNPSKIENIINIFAFIGLPLSTKIPSILGTKKTINTPTNSPAAGFLFLKNPVVPIRLN